MDKTNSKILTMSFAIAGALTAFTLQLLIKAFAGAFGWVASVADSDFVRHALPVLIGIGLFVALQFNKKVLAWGDEVVVEVKKVVFPSQKDTTAMTIVVIIMVLISSVIISSFDFLSGYFVNQFIR